MSKFFRRKRRNLTETGQSDVAATTEGKKGSSAESKSKVGKPVSRTGRYLKYAIGEIILVVIGIMIALQVNNWNENRKNGNLENEYYCRILADFDLEQEYIEDYYATTNQKIEAAKQLIIDMYESDKDNYTMMNSWIETQRLPVYVPRRVAFDDLKSSGNFKLLKDVEIKNSLALYYGDLDNILKQMNQNRDFLVQRSFPEDPVGFGIQELDYLKNVLGQKIYGLLDEPNWIHNPDQPYFKKFQNDIIMTIALYDRAKQHVSIVEENMKRPFELLKNKCDD